MRDVNLKIATEGGGRGVRTGASDASTVRQQIFPSRLHVATAVRLPGRQGAPAQDLSRGRGVAARFRSLVSRHRHEQGTGPQHAVPRLPHAEPGPAVVEVTRPVGALVRSGKTARLDGGAGLHHLRPPPPPPPPRHKLSANTRRSCSARRSPKLSIGVCTRSHVVLAGLARTGMGSDCRDFDPLLFDAWRRHPRRRVVLADAGYDSEANHRIARVDMNVRSLIKTGAGRPGKKTPRGGYLQV